MSMATFCVLDFLFSLFFFFIFELRVVSFRLSSVLYTFEDDVLKSIFLAFIFLFFVCFVFIFHLNSQKDIQGHANHLNTLLLNNWKRFFCGIIFPFVLFVLRIFRFISALTLGSLHFEQTKSLSTLLD